MKGRSAVSGALQLGLLGLLAFGVDRGRAVLTQQFTQLRLQSDVYALPSPERTVVASLGYRDALADMIYANVLVSYGLHFQEKRRFEFVGSYLDTINALSPKFRDPYRFADTLLTLQPKAPLVEDYRKARAILERGLRELPYDAELWLTAGQFAASLAPAHLNPEEKDEWRLQGARWLSHACELVGDRQNLPYHCVTAAGLLSRAGEQAATSEFVERVLAVSDDEKIRQLALGYLSQVFGERERSRAAARDQRFQRAWAEDARFVSKDLLLLLGPTPKRAARCAGPSHAGEEGCWSTWRAFGDYWRNVDGANDANAEAAGRQ